MTTNLVTRPKCPECDNGHLIPFTRNEELDFDLGEETIKVAIRDVPLERCDVCELIASGPPAAKVRHEAVCRAAGLLTPTEIKAIRETFGWSQQEFADLTGCGVATISRWERGRLLQNKAMDCYLRLLERNPDNVRILEELQPVPKQQLPKPRWVRLSVTEEVISKSQRYSLFRQLEPVGNN